MPDNAAFASTVVVPLFDSGQVAVLSTGEVLPAVRPSRGAERPPLAKGRRTPGDGLGSMTIVRTCPPWVPDHAAEPEAIGITLLDAFQDVANREVLLVAGDLFLAGVEDSEIER